MSGLLTVAMSSTGFAQNTPGPVPTDATTSGGMNVPTSVSSVFVTSSQLPEVVTLTSTMTTMTTMAKPTVTVLPPHHGGGTCECGTGSCYTPEICGLECTTIYDECCSIEGTDIEICKKQYTVCLGYSSFDFVKPVCKHDQSYYIEYESKYDSHYFEEKYGSYYESSSSHHSGSSYHEGYYTAEYCCTECTTVYDQCCSVPGADITICKETYTTCLGYNPFEIIPYQEPTTCKHEESYYSEYESTHGEEYYNSEYDNYSHENYDVEVDVAQCCVECTTVYDECCKIAGTDIEVCKEEYTICLGYNPFTVVPYVAPTVCKHGSSDNSGYEHGSSDNSGYEHGSSDNSGYEHGSSDNSGYEHGDVAQCCVECTTVYDECCKVPGADITICKDAYTVCLGYNPFTVVPYVAPTVCKHGDDSSSSSSSDSYSESSHDDYSSSSSSSEEECCVQCTTVYDECCSADSHDIETCKTEYTTCLGYSPFDVTPYVKPTVCKHGDNSGSNSKSDSHGDYSDKTGSDSKSDNHGDYSDKTGSDSKGNSNSGDYSNSKGDNHSGSSSSSGSDEECCVECTTVYKACCDASGALVETCKTAYSTCLGYSPFEVTPYVEPTVCKHGSSSSDDIVIVSGGETVRPVLALLVMGFVALLC
ncbi:Ff.00g131230.m01.CDS01 [Fusarium sp. VM40]|nr:Ff.00g131230.m01.CDS01 [Fusarium sp. VM40]